MHSRSSANIHGRSLADWIAEFPLIAELAAQRETAWFNPAVAPAAEALADVGLGLADAEAAERRLARFAPLLARFFLELEATGGSMVPTDEMAKYFR